MKISNMVFSLFLIGVFAGTVFAAVENTNKLSDAVDSSVDLNKYIYSYGAVLKVGATEIVLQEYDYDSDVEKEVSYQIDSAIKLEGFKAVSDLAVEDVVEVYYLEQDGKKIAKIIRREIIEDENSTLENT